MHYIQHLLKRRRRVPILRQTNTTECGAACLAMILSYYGRRISVMECRDRLGVGRDGVSARMIVQLARDYGLRVKSFSVDVAQLAHIPLPAVAHWNFNHFVVITSWTPKRVDIVDPAVGARRLTAEEFSRSFTGVVLTFEPGVHFTQHANTANTWRVYIRHLLRVPGFVGLLLQAFTASIVLQVLGLALPLTTKVIVDQIIPFPSSDIMLILGLGMGIVILAQWITGYLRAVVLVHLQGRFDAQIMLGLFEHVLDLPFKFFQQRPTGDLLMRLSSSVVIREMLTNQTLSILLDSLLVFVYLIILLVQMPAYGLIALAIGSLQLLLLLLTTPRVHDLMQRHLIAQSESQSYMVQALDGIATLKASGSESIILDYWSNMFYRELKIAIQRNHLAAFINTTLSTLRIVGPFLLLWFGSMQVLNGSLSLGGMLALNAIGAAFLLPLSSLVTTGQQLQLAGAHIQRILDLVEAQPEQRAEEAQTPPVLTGQVALENISFTYAPNTPMVLNNINLTIEPGQKVALVGRTGCGKSTLALLLLGLYTPTTGRVLYDGLSLSDLSYRMVRNQFGVVLQESLLFNGSIRQNISLNDVTRSLEQVMEAARLAGIHDEIMRMPMRYETILGEGGAGLSGGQRQRLSLARALAHQPKFVLLDEATSHLDVATEALVDSNLSQLPCTRIVIAHRLSTVRNADLIVVLDNGCIVEQGTHNELLTRDGYYAMFVRCQLEQQTATSF